MRSFSSIAAAADWLSLSLLGGGSLPTAGRDLSAATAGSVRTGSGAGLAAGAHILRVYQVDASVVLDKIVLDAGGLRPSYLGPPETRAQK